MTDQSNDRIDLNGDGKVDEKEYAIYERKAINRRRLAWVALIAMIATAFSMLFFVSETRLDKIKDILDLYWISLGGITGAYVGLSAWASKK